MSRLLFFDIDGTLVTRDNTVPQSAWKAIEECRQNGDHVFLCSGRTKTAAMTFECPQMDGSIFCSGAGIETEKDGQILFPIPSEDALKMRDAILSYHSGVMLFTANAGYADPIALAHMIAFGKAYGNHGPDEILKIYSVKPMDQYTGEPVLKMDVYFADSEVCHKFEQENLTDSAVWQNMTGFNSEQTELYGEINPKGVSKGTAVEKILELYGAKKEEAYGFGDSMNDAGMMEACGHGIAMGNGVPALKAMAEYVTDSVDEDGIAKAMKHYKMIS